MDMDTKKPVKSKDLDELCEIFGDTGGVKAYQDGVDVDEVRQWFVLNEKYAPFLPTPDRTDDGDGKKKKPKDKAEKFAAEVERLSNIIEKRINSEITKLKAMIPGADKPKTSSIAQYAASKAVRAD